MVGPRCFVRVAGHSLRLAPRRKGGPEAELARSVVVRPDVRSELVEVSEAARVGFGIRRVD